MKALIALVVVLSVGLTAGLAKPPPWAPANGYRAKYSYRYFPAQEVYYRPSDSVWFYVSNGGWAVGASLPAGISVNLSAGVSLEMDTDQPYTFHADVKAAYPKPGSANKDRGESEPGKGHGKGKKK